MTTGGRTVSPQAQREFTMLCWDNNLEEVRRILAAQPEAVHWRHPDSGDTGLTYVAALGIEDCAIATLLLDGGADPDVKNNKGFTALMLATIARNGSEAHIALLLDKGADQTIRNNDGHTAEEIAKSIGRPEIAAEFDKYRQREAQRASDAKTTAQAQISAQVETLRAGTQTPLQVRKKPLQIKPKANP